MASLAAVPQNLVEQPQHRLPALAISTRIVTGSPFALRRVRVGKAVFVAVGVAGASIRKARTSLNESAVRTLAGRYIDL